MRPEIIHPIFQFLLYILNRLFPDSYGSDVMAGRVDGKTIEIGQAFTGKGVDYLNRLDRISKVVDPNGAVLLMGRIDIQYITSNTESAASEGDSSPNLPTAASSPNTPELPDAPDLPDVSDGPGVPNEPDTGKEEQEQPWLYAASLEITVKE